MGKELFSKERASQAPPLGVKNNENRYNKKKALGGAFFSVNSKSI
ncbi:hypothetical protein [Dethiobacter alkaliphilus]|nr:hypothetical protein [Dethiobacter alkaliphilus]